MSKMSTMGSVSGPMPALAQAQAMGGRRRRGKWLWLLASVALIFVLGGLGFFGWGLWAYANHDHIDQIDDPQVVAIVESACATMTREVRLAAVSPGVPVRQQSASIRRQDAAVQRMVATIGGVGPDRIAGDVPTQAWLDDWQRLEVARIGADITAGVRVAEGVQARTRVGEEVSKPIAPGRRPCLLCHPR
jgi:hypothetical protein